ncbi:MAG: DUF1489 family protein [Gemmobacter sp.]
MTVHILKLCVGAESVEDLAGWQKSQAWRWPKGRAVHVTRMWPKRADEVTDGGSLYWVIKGLILCRQPILALEQMEEGDGITRCALHLDAAIIRTESTPKRPFQGWRYLTPADAPRDLAAGRAREDALPPGLATALAEIGLR